MLNIILAWTAAAVWSAAYGLFFARDVRRWWRTRDRRRAEKIAERASALATYAAWARNIPPPPPPRQTMMPQPRPSPVRRPPATAAGGYGGNVIPFPRRTRRR